MQTLIVLIEFTPLVNFLTNGNSHSCCTNTTKTESAHCKCRIYGSRPSGRKTANVESTDPERNVFMSRCISGTDLLRQLYLLPHGDRSNLLSHLSLNTDTGQTSHCLVYAKDTANQNSSLRHAHRVSSSLKESESLNTLRLTNWEWPYHWKIIVLRSIATPAYSPESVHSTAKSCDQVMWQLTLPRSTSFVVMTMTLELSCQTILQKSAVVLGTQPCVAMYVFFGSTLSSSDWHTHTVTNIWQCVYN